MASMPLALSVHNFINSVGADAGFASVVGLAILILLYFAHAREAASLRDEAAALAQRLEEAETRLAQAQRAQQPAPAEAAAQPVSAVARVPAAPAGMAAPALAAATRFIPIRIAQPAVLAAGGGAVAARAATATAARPAAPATAPAPVASPAPATPPTSPAGPVPAPRPVAVPAPVAAVGSPQGAAVASPPATTPSPPAPATVAGGANGSGRAAPAGVADPQTPAPGGHGGSGAAVLRRPGTSASFPRAPSLSSRPDNREGGVWPRIGLVLGAMIVVAAAVAAVVLTTGTGSQKPSSSTPASNAPIPGHGFKPSHVTVAVLNGTAVNQLAHRVAGGLAAEGYKKGLIATASNQTLSTTQVAYLPGRTNRIDALHVARALHLRTGDVVPVDQAALAVACPPPGACTANVVVTVGADLAHT